MAGKVYTEKQLADLFRAGVSRGIIVGAMILNGYNDKCLVEIDKIWPDFKGSLKKIKK